MADPRALSDEAVPLPIGHGPWHTLEVHDVERALGSTHAGLSSDEARRRRAVHGWNEFEMERETPAWRILLRQFRDPLVYILLVAAGVTLAIRDFSDTGVIVVVVAIDVLIAFFQERRAQHAMRALTKLTAPKAEAIRDGSRVTIASRELIPGDVVVLTSGTRVPADLRLSRVHGLEIDESALTGESVPARKTVRALPGETLVPGDQTNMAFAGTVVTRGRAHGVVVRIGAGTELGRVATVMRQLGRTATPLQERTRRLGRQVVTIVVLLGVAVLAIGIARSIPPTEILLTAVALAVSVIPEGLPVVLTVALAIGVQRMARRHAIVRVLPAVETLGSTTIIGSDKTGTLTKNEMTVKALWAGGHHYTVTGVGYDTAGEIQRDDLRAAVEADAPLRLTLVAGVLANEADAPASAAARPQGDPTELALHVVAAKAGLSPVTLRREHAELDVLPFEPDARFMATLNEYDTGRRVHVKGAPEAILARCDRLAGAGGSVPLDRALVQSAAAALGARGLRVLAMAYRATDATTLAEVDLHAGFCFVGLQGIEDPVRPEAVAAVSAVQRAGIRVLMLTGDHAATARAVGKQLGLGSDELRVVEGHDIATLSDDELDHVLTAVDIYARVAPAHKLRIVQRLKAHDHIVAVTGDGVNDAPALRAAHVGIAMGVSGTDVAREAADMVLADDNFATIAAAVEEGRVVFSNVRKVTFFLLSTAVGEVVTIVFALLAGWPLPFLAAQILWINLVTNGLQDVALAFEPREPGLLERGPRPLREGLVTWRIMQRLAAVGAVLAAGTLAIFWWALHTTGDLAYARSVAVTQMVVFQFFHAFNSRSLDRSIFAIPPFSNPFLFLGVLLAAGAHIAVLYTPIMQPIFRLTPIGLGTWGAVLLVGASVIAGGELDKWWNRRRRSPIG